MPSQETNWRDSLGKLTQSWQVPEVRKRIIFVAGMLLLYVCGLHIPAPFVNPKAAQNLLSQGVLGMIDLMSGGALKRLSILALGIVPYINASIIMQLLGIAVPAVQRLQKEGETGRKVLSLYTRWGTVILAFLQAGGLGIVMYQKGAVEHTFGILGVVPLVLVMAAGTSFLMWMGEQLTDKGIGNGVSLIIFAGIMTRIPFSMGQIFSAAGAGSNIGFAVARVALILLVFMAIVVFIIFVNQATRQIPIQHAKRVVGNRVFNSANTYLPLKVVTAGVIPIIFAISLVMLPGTIAQMFANMDKYKNAHWLDYLRMLSPGMNRDIFVQTVHIGSSSFTIPIGALVGGLIYFLLVVFFTYFYTAVVYNVQDISDNLKKNGSFIPGLRPGKQTEKYIDMVLTRITFAGALFLGVVALLPYVVPAILASTTTAANSFQLWGGTSLLIVVGVALETIRQLEAHMVMRHYEGFIR